MKFSSPSGLLSAVLVSSFAFGAVAENHGDALAHEDEQFWDRFLEGGADSLPTPSPPTPPTPPTPQVDCNVNVNIDCVSTDGTPCREIEPPLTVCAYGPDIDYVTFGYSPAECDPSGNDQGGETFCEDCEPLTEGPVTVFCKNNADGSDMVVEPSTVPVGGTFTVSSPGGGALPEKIDCIYRDGDGTKIQQVIVDTSGDVSLNLKDTFGSFTLLSCAPDGEETSCLETLCYNIELSNVGTVNMAITLVDFTFQDDVASLLPVSPNPLAPDQTIELTPKVDVDICTGEEFCASIRVEADPPNGDMCLDEEDYKFTVPFPPPVPPPVSPPLPPPVSPPLPPPVSPPLPPPVSPPLPPPVSPPLPPPVSPPLPPPVSPPLPPPVSPPLPPPVSPPVPPPVSPPVPPPPPCDVEVDLICVTADGRPCNEIEPPSTLTCTGGADIEVVAFSYQNCLCDPTANGQGDAAFCEDSAPLVEDDVTVECVGLDVSPATVPPGGIFSVTVPGGGPLPDSIDCSISGPDGTLLQQNVIDTSGAVSLELGDKFGALQLESCNDLTCKELLCYTIDMSNVGGVEMDITAIDFTLDDSTVSFLDKLTNPTVPVGETVTVEEKIVVDICGGQEYCASVNVEANPPDGEMCQDTDEDKWSVPPVQPPPPTPVSPPTVPPPVPPPISPPLPPPIIPPTIPPPVPPPISPPIQPPIQPPVPPPSPGTCVIDIETDCTIAGDSSYAGQSCDIPQLGVEPCLERPTMMTMLYNGGGCAQSDNTQELKFTCEDFMSGPPVNEGERSYIVVTDIKGDGITYFEGEVGVGELFDLSDGGERVEANMFIMIYTPDQSTLLQMVQFHSSCSSNLELKNRFGASQLVAFFNEVQGEVSCFATFTYALDIAVPITAIGEDIEITSLTAMTNFAGEINLTDQVVGMVLGPGGSVVVTLMGTIDATERMRYTIIYNIEGIRVSDGAMCSGMEMVSFEAGNVPGAMAPAGSPTDGSPDSKKSKNKRHI